MWLDKQLFKRGRRRAATWLIALLIISAGLGVLMGLIQRGVYPSQRVDAASMAITDTLTLYAQKDAWIDAGDEAANHGNEYRLEVGRFAGDLNDYDLQILIQFNLAELPANAVVTQARLELYQSGGQFPETYAVWADALSQSWDEKGVTWANKPPAAHLGDAAAQIDTATGWKEWDVTQIAQRWAADTAQNYGILLRGDGQNLGSRTFWAREGEVAPRLTISYTVATVTPTPPASATPTASPTPTHLPTLIPILQPTPFTFEPIPPQWDKINPLVFTNIRVTQGLDYDVPAGLAYDRIAGKETLARFQLHTLTAPRTLTGYACAVYRAVSWAPFQEELVGFVPGELGGSATIGTSHHFPDPARTIKCWIPGDMVAPTGWYKVVAYVNDSDGYSWVNDLGGYRQFKETIEYFGWFIYPAFQLPEEYDPPEPEPQTALNAATRAQLTGVTIQTMQRLWPIPAGIEAVKTDGSNPHTAGLRYFLSPSTYACGALERDHPYNNPNTGLPDPRYTCGVHQRAAANSAMAQFNLYALFANLVGTEVDVMQLGTVAVPFDGGGGGQSCWSGHQVAGQGVSTFGMDGAVMAHEPAHCLGIVWQGPHVDPNNTAHSITGDITLWFGEPLINFRTRADVFAFQSTMNPWIYRFDDQQMLEGFEWNRLRGILMGHDPCAGGCATAAQGVAAIGNRFFLSGRIDQHNAWTTDFSLVVTASVPLATAPTSGDYAVVVLDAAETELARRQFAVDFAVADGDSPPFLSFDFTLDYPDGAALVRVVHGARVLAELVPPSQTPSVAFDSVRVNDNAVTAQWHSDHPQGAPLTYALHFSPDDGETRIPLATSLATTTYTWTTDLASGTEMARLIVVATDGFNTAEAHSDSFVIPRKPPVAAISAPAGASDATLVGARTLFSNVIVPTATAPITLVASQAIELRGSGFDLNDGYLQGDALRWASDVQGPLGIGERLAVRLAAGAHILMLQAVSTADMVGSDSVAIEVLADEDGDGLPDVYEDNRACLDRADADDAGQDQDDDGLTALAEFRIDTAPCIADTDGDGENDGAEFAGGSNPLDENSMLLPELAAQPEPLSFVGCGAFPAPDAQTISMVGASVVYSATVDAAWLRAARQPDGTLEVAVSCDDVEASPVAGNILVTADGYQPLLIPVMLRAGTENIYLPLVLKG